MTITLDLPTELQEQARELAAGRGESVEALLLSVVREYLQQEMEDMEDARLADEAYAAYLANPSQARSLAEVVAEMESEGLLEDSEHV
jgi:predicted DNA-binding protein